MNETALLAHDRADSAPPSAPNRRRRLILAGIVALVYLAGVTGAWWITPDSALYLGLGRSLATGQGYVFNGRPHTFVGPGLPVLLAGVRLLTGPGFWGPNLLLCLCGLAALCVIWRVFTRVADRDRAWILTLLVASTYAFYFNSHRILSDMPFFLLFWTTILAALRWQGAGGPGWLIVVGLLSIASVVIRVPGLAALGILSVSLLVQARSADRLWRPAWAGAVILLSLLAAGGSLFLAALAVGRELPPYTHILTLIGHQSLDRYLWHFGLALRDLPAETAQLFVAQDMDVLGGVLLVLGLVGSGVLWIRGQRLWAVLWILYPLSVGFLGGAGAIRSRYLLPVLPAMVYAVLTGLELVARKVTRLRGGGPQRAASAVRVAVAILVLFNAPKVLRHAVWYAYLSYTPRYYDVTQHGAYAGVFDAAEAIRRVTPPDARTLTRHDARILHFLTQRIVAPFEPAFRKAKPPRLPAWPADAASLVLRLPDDQAVADHLADPAVRSAHHLEPVFAGKRYEVYRIAKP